MLSLAFQSHRNSKRNSIKVIENNTRFINSKWFYYIFNFNYNIPILRLSKYKQAFLELIVNCDINFR